MIVQGAYGHLMNGLMKLAIGMLSDKIGVEPGDMHRMVEISEWLAYSLYEVAKLLKREDLL